MERIVFFGKGGIGKSTIAANLSAALAARGGRVLHIGCDPKSDSTVSLAGRQVPPFSPAAGGGPGSVISCVHPSRVKGVDCMEAGGPKPGMGCAGAGIGAMLDAIGDSGLLEKGGYSAAVFDVLGDVVCGGFAAPLRAGFAGKAVIVTSEESLSLYAANKLMAMVKNYSRNGVRLAGLAANLKDPAGEKRVREFAAAAGTRVLGVLLRDPAVTSAERLGRPAALLFPRSDFARRLVKLAAAIKAPAPAGGFAPLTDHAFAEFAAGRPFSGGRPPGGGRSVRSRPPAAAEALKAAGFEPAGVIKGQLVYDWRRGRSRYRVIVAEGMAARPGMNHVSDWAVCFHPDMRGLPALDGGELAAAAGGLSHLSFADLLACHGLSGTRPAPPAHLPQSDDIIDSPPGSGQWRGFLLGRSRRECAVPPGSVMVEHGDSDCLFSSCIGGRLNMFRGEQAASGPGPVFPKGEPGTANTGFSDGDAAGGDEDRILGAMTAAGRAAGPGALVEFYTGCSPMLLASDSAALAAEARRLTGAAVRLEPYNNFTAPAEEKVKARAAFMASRFKAAARRPKADVNIAGGGAAPAPLLRLLDRLGVSVVPAGADFYEAAASARLQVLERPDPALCPALDRAGLKWTVPPAPYGFAGTSAWAADILKGLGRPGRAAPSPAEKKAAAALRAAAAGTGACFICEAEQVEGLLSGAAFGGPRLPAALEEAGFGVSVFVRGEGPLPPRSRERSWRVVRFSSDGELSGLLKKTGGLRLVYSDIEMDRRVLEAGKIPFSLSVLLPGYEGALETCRRLLRLARWDYHGTYL
ncbi:MAG: AAA family ATPase [Elusimicrobiales bacterium]|nr:AAA family ATPase [Elusimicrobiales bacterium]